MAERERETEREREREREVEGNRSAEVVEGAKVAPIGDFAIHYQPTDIFPINLFNVYDNKIDRKVLSKITSNNNINDYAFRIIATSPTTFNLEIHIETLIVIRDPRRNTLDEMYVNAIKSFICCLLVNNPDWLTLMYQMTQERPGCNFLIYITLIDRAITDDHIHKDNSLFSSLTYLEPVERTPELSFGYNEIRRYEGATLEMPSPIVCRTTRAIFTEFTELEQRSRNHEGTTPCIYRYDISHMELPTVSFSDWLLYHGTPNDYPSDSAGSIDRRFSIGINVGKLNVLPFSPCAGRNCEVKQKKVIKRKIVRMLVKPTFIGNVVGHTIIGSVEGINIMDFAEQFKKEEPPSITITPDNFQETMGRLRSTDGIYTDECRIAMNVGGKKKGNKVTRKTKTKCRRSKRRR
uniref:Uncharacterized protein n=1 Tax=viral metagenome TaxID=1070528 RepID=A0A6C0I2C1_9ZZZZ